MRIECPKCEQVLKEGQEVRGICRAYYHELKSKVIFSVSKPHYIEAASLEHFDCREANGDESLSGG